MFRSVSVLVVSNHFACLEPLSAWPELQIETLALDVDVLSQRLSLAQGASYSFNLLIFDQVSLRPSCMVEVLENSLNLDKKLVVIVSCLQAEQTQADTDWHLMERLIQTFPGRVFINSDDLSNSAFQQVLSFIITRLQLELRLVACQSQHQETKTLHNDFLNVLNQGIGLVFLGDKQRIRYVNSYVTQHTGWIESQLIGMDINQYFNLDFNLLGQEQTINYTCPMGKSVWGAFMILPMETETEFLLLYRDIRQQRVAEKSEDFQHYHAGMVQARRELRHNIGNTINSMNSTVNQLQSSRLSVEKVGELLARFLQERENDLNNPYFHFLQGIYTFWQKDFTPSLEEPLDVLDKDINTLVRFFEGSVIEESETLQWVEVNELIASVVHSVEALVKQQGATVRFGELLHPVYLQVNENELFHVFLNLLKNAAEAIADQVAKGNDIECLITVRFGQVNEHRVEVHVHDTAGSISESVKQRIFAQGFTTKASGLGEGLHSVANFMQRHQGKVDVISQPETGTEFSLIFPAHRVSLHKP